ncbi:MAG: DNA polymerase I [Chloroflexota bacterium]|nr:DNA polymerase I [Chloroflexota bacterium]
MERKESPLFLLFDGNALVHRAFHALPPLTVSRTGEMVNAVYGFASTLLKVLHELKPTHWAIAFDRPAPTFRKELFEEYKAQRPKTPPELVSQIKQVHQLTEAFHIPIFEIDSFEADDVLGTLSQQASEQGIETIIVTGDNDMLQLVSDKVKALAPKRTFNDTVLYDEEAVRQKYGIEPEQISDLKALAGDTSDNIPSVPGIGDKTAARLLQQFSSVDEIYSHIEDVTPSKLQAALLQHKSQVLQNRELTTIVRSVPISLNLDACQVTDYDRDEVLRLFQELEFVKLLPRLPQNIGVGKEQALTLSLAGRGKGEGEVEVIDSEAALHKVLTQLSMVNEFVIGVESISGELIGITLSPAKGRVFYITLRHGGLPFKEVSLTEVVTKLEPILTNRGVGKIAYNGKQVTALFADHGVELENLRFDVMIAAYLLGEKSLSLKSITFNKLGLEIMPPSELTGKKQSRVAALEIEDVADYACASANVIWDLRDILEGQLHQQGLNNLFRQVELPLVPVLVDMERSGVTLDTNLLREMSLSLGKEMSRLEAEIYNNVGHRFNINSPRQLGGVLFEELKLPQSRKTKTGYSTEAQVLETLRPVHPVVDFVLQYRQLSKLKSTYVDALPALVNRETGRIHTTFNQTGTTTGRLSSSEPNLQNIPIRGELGNKIRQAIIAPPESLLLSADYSQVDLRALAHLSQDPGLIAAFVNDEDVHAATASRLFGVPVEQVTSEMRRNAKTVNFGVIYGMSDYGLEQATNFTREEASQFITLYFERYSKVREYIEATKEQARKMGYVQTLIGRRRFIPEINSPNRQVKEAAERMAINAPVQGTSADIIKIAMVNLYREMRERGLGSKMLLQIHDELLFEVPREEMGEMKSLVNELMPSAVKLCVPLKIDIKLGKNWGEMA